MTELTLIVFSFAALIAALTVRAVASSAHTVGGLTFWQVGRVGGSIYFNRRS